MTSRLVARIVTALAFAVACVQARADDKPAPDDLMRAIHAEWSARQKRVKTINCKAQVESFYPRGYLSAISDLPPASRQGKPPQPEEDKRFANEPYALAIDFAEQRVRKEKELTRPWNNSAAGLEPELFPEYGLMLFADNKYRRFRPRNRIPKSWGEGTSDVVLYEGGATDGLFGFSDLPLLWLAGGVSGQVPSPTSPQYLDDLVCFSRRGEGEWGGHDCVILTVPEQKSNKSVREFWVGRATPHPIYHCRARSGDIVFWQLEVTYHEQGAELLPAQWTYTEYQYVPGNSFYRQTFSVQELDINSPISPEFFEKKLEPGMVAYYPQTHQTLEVGGGDLVTPLGSSSGKKLLTILIGAGTLLAISLVSVLLWRWLHRRRRPAS